MKILAKLSRHSYLIGILLLIYIISKINIKELGAIIFSVDKSLFAVGMLITPLIIVGMALRWKKIINSLGIKFRFSETIISHMKGMVIGELTPGKLGELYRAKYLVSKKRSTIGKALSTVVIDRVYDVFLLIALALPSIVILTKIYAFDVSIYAVLLFSVILVIGICVFMNEKWLKKLLQPAFSYLVPKRYMKKANFNFHEFYIGIKLITKRKHAECLAISLFIWFLKFLSIYILALALGIVIPFWFVVLISSVITLVSILPITVSGLGTREAMFIFFLSVYQVAPEKAIALSLLYLFLGSWLMILSIVVSFTYSAIKNFR